MSPVKVRILGSGDAFGSGGRLQSCLHIDLGYTQILLDCGTTALLALRKWQLSLGEIEAIYLSHLHGDHFGGLPILLLKAQIIDKRTHPLLIAGPPGLAVRLKQAQEVLYPGSSNLAYDFPLRISSILESIPHRHNNVEVTAYPVDHYSGAPSYALRVRASGKTIAYSGDTAWTPTLVDVSKDADLFICESNYYDKDVQYHLNYETLMAHVPELTCRRLVLTHLGEEMIRMANDLAIETAEDGMIIVV